jgi:hypothetical protein
VVATRYAAKSGGQTSDRHYHVFLPVLTSDMFLDQHRQLVQHHFRDINIPYSLFDCSANMRYDLDNFVDKCAVRRDLRVPDIDKVLDDYCDNGVQLNINVIRAGEWRQHSFYGR